ncbi:MAG: hydrogenase 3 maturation endopeptidase HyCI [Candidatus Omnitrophica bacterium]|nr:hydrogenase 3 maturation endopeptidase HyCI [Candidatus Omnitrophota bacterium]MCM8798546.1 hydrogenase 3 maturation endopeptidase HyCI [Candidatus Omnitrophota bacterium]
MEIDILERLKKSLVGKVVILGIGNPLRGDDAFGSLFAEELMGKISLIVLNGGSNPENLLGKIIQENPDTILFVDAVDLGRNWGDTSLFEADEVKASLFFFTHNSSLRLIFDFLKENTQAKIHLLAIQPKSINLGDKLSAEIEEKLNFLTGWFIKNYSL